MARDELDERVRQAAEADPTTVDRVVRSALAIADRSAAAWEKGAPAMSIGTWPRAFGMLGACLVAVVALGVWWSGRQPASPPASAVRALVKPIGAGRVIRVTTGDGTTWILSMTPDDDWMPAGSVVVVGGAEGR